MLLPSSKLVGPVQVSPFAPKKCILCIKSGKNEQKSKNSAFSDVNWPQKTKSRRKYDMVLMEIFLAFRISNRIFRSMYHSLKMAGSLNTAFRPKMDIFGTQWLDMAM